MLLLPFDLLGQYEELDAAAAAADAAFGGSGVDYLVHNAGVQPCTGASVCVWGGGGAGEASRRMEKLLVVTVITHNTLNH